MPNLTDILIDPILYEIKVVPDDAPNSDGVWLSGGWHKPRRMRWSDLEKRHASNCPEGHHIVAVRRK